MANVEKSGYMKYKDESGNMTTMYPKTNVANVEGLSDELSRLDKVFLTTRNSATFADIQAAYNAGKIVVMTYGSRIFMLGNMSSSSALFFNITPILSSETATSKGISVNSADEWTTMKTLAFAPQTHASRHASTGADPITPASIGAATMTEVNTAIQSAIQNTWEASY